MPLLVFSGGQKTLTTNLAKHKHFFLLKLTLLRKYSILVGKDKKPTGKITRSPVVSRPLADLATRPSAFINREWTQKNANEMPDIRVDSRPFAV